MDPWDRLAGRVKSARQRAECKPDNGHGFRPAQNIIELERLRVFIEQLIDEELIRARAEGMPWGTLGTSKQQAQQRHKRAVAAMEQREGQRARRAAARDARSMPIDPQSGP